MVGIKMKYREMINLIESNTRSIFRGESPSNFEVMKTFYDDDPRLSHAERNDFSALCWELASSAVRDASIQYPNETMTEWRSRAEDQLRNTLRSDEQITILNATEREYYYAQVHANAMRAVIKRISDIDEIDDGDYVILDR